MAINCVTDAYTCTSIMRVRRSLSPALLFCAWQLISDSRAGGVSGIITLQKHLGYFNHTFRLSELHQCDQEMLIGRLS